MAERSVTVDELLMPGTPEFVAARYRSLAERAERTSFDMLEEDIVVLDTETTGLSFRECELIQIAAARVSGREVVERFETFVRPHGPIPAEIVALTGISDADVADAPRDREAVAALAEFVGGMPILAHNALFDRTFVERVAGGHAVSDIWIDTLALSRMALPRLTSHRLADLASAFGCEAVTHRAGDDVDALVGVWRIILLGLADLPHGLLGQLAGMHPEVDWAFRPVLTHLAADDLGEAAAFSLRDVRHGLVEALEAPRPDVAERTEPLCVPSREEVAAAFAPGGVVAAMYGAAPAGGGVAGAAADSSRPMGDGVASAGGSVVATDSSKGDGAGESAGGSMVVADSSGPAGSSVVATDSSKGDGAGAPGSSVAGAAGDGADELADSGGGPAGSSAGETAMYGASAGGSVVAADSSGPADSGEGDGVASASSSMAGAAGGSGIAGATDSSGDGNSAGESAGSSGDGNSAGESAGSSMAGAPASSSLAGPVASAPAGGAAAGGGDGVASAGSSLAGPAGGSSLAGARASAYEERPDQLAMALEVREALATGTHRAIEAGTGVGKSVAYLLPEVLFAQANRLTVGVATKTNALTDQLVSHELPALATALPNGVSFVSLKGYDHYPCLRKLELAAGGSELLAGQATAEGGTVRADEVLTALAVTYAFACQSPEGDLDALGIRWRVVPRELLVTTPSECRHGRCPFFPNECLLHGARRRAAAADVVVTNHSLLLRNVMAEGKILPPVRYWVVDEAHGFEAEARRQWAREVSGLEARRGFEALGGTRSGVIRALLVQVGGAEGEALYLRLLTGMAASVSRAAVSSAEFFDALHGLLAVARGGGGYDQTTLWIDARVRQSEAWAALDTAGWKLVERLDEAVKDAGACVAALSDEAPSAAADLTEATRFLRDMRAGVELVLEGSDDTYVYSAELSRRRADAGSERLVAEKVDVGADLAARWLPEMESVVFSSATIAVGESFEHFDHAVGLDLLPAGAHTGLRLASSYDFDANMAVVVCRDLPAPSEREYLPALEDLLFNVHVGMGGSVLTLFTNRREMEAVWKGLRPRLERAGLELACQERGTSPRRLREQFLADRKLSLLALRSFWEGFDAAGDTLRCVVIPKLPFASPNDPLVRERDRREERSWWRHSLPEAVIAVKQAAGRLIRSSTDTGMLVLADSRLVSKRYGRTFIASLPSNAVATLEADHVERYIELWRSGHER